MSQRAQIPTFLWMNTVENNIVSYMTSVSERWYVLWSQNRSALNEIELNNFSLVNTDKTGSDMEHNCDVNVGHENSYFILNEKTIKVIEFYFIPSLDKWSNKYLCNSKHKKTRFKIKNSELNSEINSKCNKK